MAREMRCWRGEAAAKTRRSRRPLGRDHGKAGPGTQEQQPVPGLVDVISVGDGHTSQGTWGFSLVQAVLTQVRPVPEALVDGHRVPIPTRDAGRLEARKERASKTVDSSTSAQIDGSCLADFYEQGHLQ